MANQLLDEVPEYILRTIFEWATIIDEANQFKTALNISHVCRAWYLASVDISFLWTHINLSANTDIEIIKDIVNTVLPRMGSRPPTLSIRNITRSYNYGATSQKLIDIMEILQIKQFKAIRCLQFHVPNAFEANLLIHPVISYSSGPLDELVFSTDYSSSSNSRSLDFDIVLNHFPTVRAIRLSRIPPLTMYGDALNHSVKALTLSTTDVWTVPKALSTFASLTELTLTNVELYSVSQDMDILVPSLQALSIMDNMVRIFPWKQVHAPQLVKLYLDYNIGDNEIEFVARHGSIKWIHTWSTYWIFLKLAYVAPQVEALQAEPLYKIYPETGESLISVIIPSTNS